MTIQNERDAECTARSQLSLVCCGASRMAARMAGRDPDEHLKIALAEVVPFDDLLWRYPDFLTRAEAAYHALITPNLTLPPLHRAGMHPLAP